MNRSIFRAGLALSLLTLTACTGGTEATTSNSTSASPSPTASATSPGSTIKEINAEVPITHKFTDEAKGKITFRTAQDVECEGKPMKKLTLDIQVNEDASGGFGYFANSWKAYSKDGAELPGLGFTEAAQVCTPEHFLQVFTDPGKTSQGVYTFLEVGEADRLGIESAWGGPTREITISF